MKQLPSDWPPERVAELTRRFNDGESFASIAGAMALTRNAVIGKCNRLGLVRDPPPSLALTRSAAAKTGNLTRKLRPRSDSTKNKTLSKLLAPKFNLDFESVNPNPAWVEYDAAIPRRRRKKIATLGPRDCKFIVGDPQVKGWFFCGARKLPSLPYCAEHARRCFYPANSCRRDRERS
jgi:GcrA cell cycle regulator